MRGVLVAICLTLAGALAAPAQTPTGQSLAAPLGDAAAGAVVFNRDCAFCHEIGPDAANRVGPQLNRIYDRGAGSLEDVRYSRGLIRMGVDGLVWTYETLDAYIANPRALVSGTRMSYRGLRDETERHDLLAYLRAYSEQPQNIPESAPTARRTMPDLSPETLQIEGDREYGEYLAAECTTCHQLSGTDDGIPAITGWLAEDFVVAMHAYKQGLRPHPVMQMMAQRLDAEQIAALAAYFATIPD
ncbi:c-type cytochrome [Pararhodobacter sp.]|uniref:c-type cytochrome n=1 Tax=Pararhodobacter sp. TaxID=2127056 RepID=UPI002AFE223B|nr:c-type cytochrome [Pararhodobacter sp.]